MANSYKELNAPELVSQWRRIVNGDVMNGRDAHMLRKAMDENGWSPCQILLGFYTMAGRTTISIPIFLRHYDQWLVEEDFEAQINLAVQIAGYKPQHFWTYYDLLDTGIESATLRQKFNDAKWELQQWADRILEQPASTGRKKVNA